MTQDRFVVITGASRGIGRALALDAARRGHTVAAVARDVASLGALVDESKALSGLIVPAVADVADAAGLAAAAADLGERFGAADLLVANAGRFSANGPTWQIDPAAWSVDVTVNLLGVQATVAAFVPAMVARASGRVVVMTSGLGNGPGGYFSAYTASKAGLTNLAMSLDVELAVHGIGVFPVSPGMVETDLVNWPAGFTDWVPGLRDLPAAAFTPVEKVVDLVAAIDGGQADAAHGRFLRSTDDLAVTVRAIADGPDSARRLGLLPYGPADPQA